MRQPHSIRFHLTAVFLLFFLLVVVLGMFSIWRLSNFNRLSADVAEVWLPNTRALGDLNNFTSDFRAFEGNSLLSSDPADVAATEQQMAALDRSIAEAERSFERIRRDAAENELYGRFKQHWNDYRTDVNQIVALSHANRKTEALAIYAGASRAAYDAASDTLGQLTDRAVANAQAASDRLGVAYRQAFWLILLGMVIAGIMVVAALIHVSRSISSPLLHLADRMRRLAANNTDIDIPETERRDEIGEMAQATVVFRNNALELMRSQRTLARQAAMLEEQLAQEQRLALAQRNFVSMASHEFRTPLTIIDGHARRLEKMREGA
ncbi:MAG: MCP four helix bundle domain-containing protein, partial [Xanthobacteraceae bacterium]